MRRAGGEMETRRMDGKKRGDGDPLFYGRHAEPAARDVILVFRFGVQATLFPLRVVDHPPDGVRG